MMDGLINPWYQLRLTHWGQFQKEIQLEEKVPEQWILLLDYEETTSIQSYTTVQSVLHKTKKIGKETIELVLLTLHPDYWNLH